MLRDNRFRLITLGRLTLVGGTGEEDASLAKRRFKLALLTVLAMARRPLSRDALLEMFWGDRDEARARHSLSNALSSLRRALGQRAITTRDTDVALATDLPLDVDALELMEAAEARDTARVVDLYGGPFLDGVHVDESPAFDQWIFRERRRLEAVFLQACAQQCGVLARARRWTECRALAARWLDTEPLSADAAIFVLNAIKATGTRAALAEALHEYERLRTRLDREFDLAPEPVVRELASRIREQLATMAEERPAEPERTTEPSSAATVGTTSAASTPATVPLSTAVARASAETAASAAPAPAPRGLISSSPEPSASTADEAPHGGTGRPGLPPPHIHGRRNLGRVVALGAIGVAALAIAVWGARRSTRTAAGHKPVIAVLAMDVRDGDSTVAWLGQGLPQMITGKLAHIGAVDVVTPTQVRGVLARAGRTGRDALDDDAARDLARRVGATLVAQGVVGRDAGKLVLELTIHDVESGSLVRNDVLTRSDALALADEAAARILGAANVNVPGPQMAGLETSSVEAYQHYMRALEAGQAGRRSEMKRELEAAIALDSGFIPVVRTRINVAVTDNDTALVRRLRATMQRYASRASEFDRLDQEANDAYLRGERERSEALARGIVRRFPRDPRSYQLLESFLGSHGEREEAERVAIQGYALDSLAMEAGTGPCTQCLGFNDIIGFHWLRLDFRGAAEWARRWIRMQPDGASAWASLAWTFAYVQRPDSALPLMQRAVSLSGGDVWATDEFARMLLVARRYDAADSAISSMEASMSAERRETAFDLRSLLERERGRYRASNRVLDRFNAEFPGSAGFIEMVRADNLRLLGDYASAARLYEAPAHSPSEGRLPMPLPSTSARAWCWHHALAADAYAPAGDTATLRAIADTLQLACSRSFYGRDWRLHHHVRGLIAMKAGRYDEAEREFTQAVWARVEGWSRTTVELAAAQRALGRPRDAIATLRTAYATRLDAMGRYVPISELDYRMAQAFVQAGEPDSARTYAAYTRSAWRDADPEVKRLLAGLP